MIGVVIVVYNSADVILDCVESLLRQTGHAFRIVLVDNASPDDSIARVEAWGRGALTYAPPPGSPLGAPAPVPKPVAVDVRAAEDPAPFGAPLMSLRSDQDGWRHDGRPVRQHGPRGAAPAAAALTAPVTVLRAGRNLGYGGAVNLGLARLAADPRVELLWVLNPDCVVPPGTPDAFLAAQRAAGPFAIMGGRIVYHDTPHRIHADGGRVRRLSGVCESVNRGADAGTTPLPSPGSIDYVIGANMVVSRGFLEATGPMREDYFLYYEEVDWALRRGPLPLALAPGAVVYHHGGTSIGTGRLGERPSAFANYFNYRNRMRFMRRFHPWLLPAAYLAGLARIARGALRDDAGRILGALRGLHGLSPPREVAERVGPAAAPLAFGRWQAGAGHPSMPAPMPGPDARTTGRAEG